MVECVELKIEFGGVPLVRPMSSGPERADDDDDTETVKTRTVVSCCFLLWRRSRLTAITAHSLCGR